MKVHKSHRRLWIDPAAVILLILEWIDTKIENCEFTGGSLSLTWTQQHWLWNVNRVTSGSVWVITDWNEMLHDLSRWGNWGQCNIISLMFHLRFSHYLTLTFQINVPTSFSVPEHLWLFRRSFHFLISFHVPDNSSWSIWPFLCKQKLWWISFTATHQSHFHPIITPC